MNCKYIDLRDNFFSLLAEKLGEDYALESATISNREQLTDCDVIIMGLPCPSLPDFSDCLSRLQMVARNPAGIPVIASLSSDDRQVARNILMAGAYDYWIETSPLEELRRVLSRAAEYHQMKRELQQLRVSGTQLQDFSSIIGCDAKMRSLFTFASKVASTDATILITGETGSGKEVLAQAIHKASARAREPFVAVACATLPETLIEAELFGHERGAFTGATSSRRGRFEAAGQGTIFLDEIGELTPGLQVKLLRVLQERKFERLGSNQVHNMEARVICATNCDLAALVRSGQFRSDLYYRLNTIEMKVPPLRERRTDIVVFAHSFLQKYSERHKRPVSRISRAALAAMEEYDWPGNVREMQNVIERAVVICDGPEIGIEDMPEQFASWSVESGCTTITFEDEVRGFKRRLIRRVLCEHDNNKLQAARTLGIARSSLHRLIDELEISTPEHARAA